MQAFIAKICTKNDFFKKKGKLSVINKWLSLFKLSD